MSVARNGEPQFGQAPAFLAAGNSTLATRALLTAVIALSYLWDAPSIVLYGDIGLSNTVVTSSGDTVRQACFIAIFLAIGTLGVRANGVRFLLRVPTPFILLLAWCWLSLLWAIEPSLAIRRLLFTTLIVLSVAYSVERLSYRQVIELLLNIFAFILIADWLAVAIFPLAVHQAGESDPSLVGNWRGIHNHKNEAGAFSAMCLILFVHEAARARSWMIGGLLSVLAAAFLYETRSKTSGGFAIVAFLIGMAAVASYGNPSLRKAGSMIAIALVILGMAFISEPLSPLMKLLDDPAALTGRVQIWPILTSYAHDHPFGAGYGSFWAIGDASPIYQYGSGWVTTVDHAHNGYLELLVEIGFIGLALVLGVCVFHPFHRLFTKPLAGDTSRALIGGLLAFGCLHDLLETSLLNRANPSWVIMLVMYFLLAKEPAAGAAATRDDGQMRTPAA